MSALECQHCPVRDSAACAALSDHERSELARRGETRTYRRGETVFAANDTADKCATLTAGMLKITHYDAQGNERILSLVHPSGFVGELFAPMIAHDIVALTESHLCVFPRRRYEQALERYPALTTALLRRSAEDLYDARAQIALDGRKSAASKMACFLLAVAKAASHSPCHPVGTFDLPLNRGEIANLLGLTIETVSRQIGRFEKDEIILREGPRGVRIQNAARLEEIAG